MKQRFTPPILLIFAILLMTYGSVAQPETTPENTPVVETVTETPIFVPTSEPTPEATEETITFPDLPTDIPATEEILPTDTPLPLPTELPAGFQLLSPAHKSTVTDKNITFSWTEVPGARWYRIHIYRNNDKEIFKRRFKNPDLICANGVCSVTLSTDELKLRDARRYKWNVVARGVDGKNVATHNQRFSTSHVSQPTAVYPFTTPRTFTSNAVRNFDGIFTPLALNSYNSVNKDLGFTINFYGKQYSNIWINVNGNLTFNRGNFYDQPFNIITGPYNTSNADLSTIIAPFFADIDTSFGGTISFGVKMLDDHTAFVVNWSQVGCFNDKTYASIPNTFQVILIDRSDTGSGNFDIEFNYNSIIWETSTWGFYGEAGDKDCLGGSSARVGYSNGTGITGTSFELPGSGVPGSFLDSNSATGLANNSLNSTQPGRYVFHIRSPIVTCDATIYVNPQYDAPSMRLYPPDGEMLTSFYRNTPIKILGYANLVSPFPDSSPDLIRWWKIWIVREGNPRPDGWIWEGLVINEDEGCIQTLPELPPDPIPPAPPPGLCLVKLNEGITATIYSSNLQTPADFYAPTWEIGGTSVAIGSTIGDDIDEIEKNAVFPVYGLTVTEDTDINGNDVKVTRYLLSPVGRVQPQIFLDYNAALPANNAYTQNWVDASRMTIVSDNWRACDESSLGRMPLYFRNNIGDNSYIESLGFYIREFVAPVDQTKYNNTTNLSSPMYNAFRVSQFPYEGHWALDIVYQPLDGRDDESIEMDVQAPYEGIVVEAGPDSITGTRFFEGIYENFPQWLQDKCPKAEGHCNPFNSYYVQFYPLSCSVPDCIPTWKLMVALWHEIDEIDGNSNEVTNATGDVIIGLIKPDVYEDIKEYVKAQNIRIACEGTNTCTDKPGRQVVIWHSANDTDTTPDIETVYVHLSMSNEQYNSWKNNCSVLTRNSRIGLWNILYSSIPQNNPCWINKNAPLGVANLIGYTTGTHLHYGVAVDDGVDPDDNNVFKKYFGAEAWNPGETVHPVISIDMHMEPCLSKSSC